MKRFVFLVLMVAVVTAQTSSEVEITAEPHHHFAFENQFVRVFTVEVPAHKDTLMHWHRHDYFFVTLGASEVVNAVKGKEPVTLKLQNGETHLISATMAHVARNLADTPFRNVTIELMQDEKLRQAVKEGRVKWDEDRG